MSYAISDMQTLMKCSPKWKNMRQKSNRSTTPFSAEELSEPLDQIEGKGVLTRAFSYLDIQFQNQLGEQQQHRQAVAVVASDKHNRPISHSLCLCSWHSTLLSWPGQYHSFRHWRIFVLLLSSFMSISTFHLSLRTSH